MNVTRLVAVVSLGLVACQTYEFERVVPITLAQTTDRYLVTARRLKPNVMLLVDNSGSMFYPANEQHAACTPGCGRPGNPACSSSCPTRISELKSAMATFLQTSGTIARFGLTIYPVPGDVTSQCKGSTDVEVQLPPAALTDDGSDAELQDTANRVNARIQSLIPSGGTPTGASLDFVGMNQGLNDATDGREDFVLLLTDGLPNCNTMNVNQLCGCGNACSTALINACNCTSASCGGGTCSLGCLDQDATVAVVKALAQKGIKTIVVGFGADLASGIGPAVLNAMAREGGFPRGCPQGTDVECGGAQGSCNTFTKQCQTSFYQAATGAELAAELEAIGGRFPGEACEYLLSESPSDPAYLAVILDGVTVLPGDDTYRYDVATNTVRFLGSTCRRIEASTPQNPIELVFRIVQRF